MEEGRTHTNNNINNSMELSDSDSDSDSDIPGGDEEDGNSLGTSRSVGYSNHGLAGKNKTTSKNENNLASRLGASPFLSKHSNNNGLGGVGGARKDTKSLRGSRYGNDDVRSMGGGEGGSGGSHPSRPALAHAMFTSVTYSRGGDIGGGAAASMFDGRGIRGEGGTSSGGGGGEMHGRTGSVVPSPRISHATICCILDEGDAATILIKFDDASNAQRLSNSMMGRDDGDEDDDDDEGGDDVAGGAEGGNDGGGGGLEEDGEKRQEIVNTGLNGKTEGEGEGTRSVGEKKKSIASAALSLLQSIAKEGDERREASKGTLPRLVTSSNDGRRSDSSVSNSIGSVTIRQKVDEPISSLTLLSTHIGMVKPTRVGTSGYSHICIFLCLRRVSSICSLIN